MTLEYLPQKGTWWFDKQTGHLLGGIGENIPQMYAPCKTYFQITEAAIDYIPEFPSWILLLLFLVVTLSGVIIRKKLRRL